MSVLRKNYHRARGERETLVKGAGRASFSRVVRGGLSGEVAFVLSPEEQP